jgi:Uma2 family endonuclease
MKRSTETSAAARLLSLEQWAGLDEDEPGELVDGVIEEEEMPTIRHELVVAWLLVLLAAWASKRRGIAVGSEAKLAIGPRRGRKPDLSVYLPPHVPRLDDAVVRVAPYLVVEVLSPRPRDARRDRIDKLADYARAGASYYWVVDPMLRTVEVLQLDERRRYTLVLAASAARVRVPGLRGLTLDLDALWSDAATEAALEPTKKPVKRNRPR